MVDFKEKVRASAYFTKLGWKRGRVFVGGVCVRGVGIYVYMVGVVWCVRRGRMYWKEGEKRNFTIISWSSWKKFYPINLIEMTKIGTKIASVQNQKKGFILNY